MYIMPFEVSLMYDKVKVTYLLNSGFILEIGDCAIIFDYYQDEKNIVDKIIQDKKKFIFLYLMFIMTILILK